MKRVLLWVGVACVLALVSFHVVHADAPVGQPPSISLSVSRAVVDEPLRDASTDPWFEEMRELVETLSDAYLDKPHASRFGTTLGEPEVGRTLRLDDFTRNVLAAARDRAGELGRSDTVWAYAATLTWIAHRETRIASNPGKLGNQDNGRAHGYWQVWTWHGADPFAASTAMDMLISEPSASWSLPKGQPWLGYPECARWVLSHPPPESRDDLQKE